MSLADLLAIDPDSDQSPYEQVRRGILGLIADGSLLVGDKLPTVRALAADLDIAPNTVARSYRELEASGIIETRGRHGSFIKAGRNDALDRAYIETLSYLESVRELGVSDDDVLKLVQRAIRRA